MRFLLMSMACLAGIGLRSAELIRQGVARAEIVLETSSVRVAALGAYELQNHLEKMTQVKLPIVSQPTGGEILPIYVGAGQAAAKRGWKAEDFLSQQYRIEVQADAIYLLGRDREDRRPLNYDDVDTFPSWWDEQGTLYAVYDFLHRLGFNWYMPTDLGIAYKRCDTLRVPSQSVCRVPSMEFRHHEWGALPADLAGDTIASGVQPKDLSSRELLLWFLRRRLGGVHRVFNHSLYLYYTRFPQNKRWFAQGYGDIKPPQLCYTNPEVIAQVVQDARDFFDRKVPANKLMSNASPDFVSDAFTLWPMDNDSFCRCAQCQKWLKSGARRGGGMFSNDASSDYWFQFVNAVAREVKKTHPDKKIATGAYASFAYPPSKVTLEDNILLMLCLHTRSAYSPKTQRNDRQILSSWSRQYPQVSKYVWMYYCFPSLTAVVQQSRYFPNFFGSHVKDVMRFYYGEGVKGLFFEPSYLPNYRISAIFDQLESYLTWELAFDASQDPDWLYAEFFENYYGPAGKVMRQFYELAESWSNDPGNYPGEATEQNDDIAWQRIGTKEHMAQLKVLMDQARALSGDEPFRSRLAVFERGIWDYMCKGKAHADKLEAMRAPSMQQASVSYQKVSSPGNSLSVNWNRATQLYLYGDLQAGPLKRALRVQVTHDGQWLYFRYHEGKIAPDQVVKDNQVWHNDEWESFFARQRGVPYRQLAVDFHGQKHYGGVTCKGTLVEDWMFPGKITVTTGADEWTVHVAVQLKDLVPGGIKPGEMLYYNVIRSHGARAHGCWIPTFAGYRAVDRLGELYLEPVR